MSKLRSSGIVLALALALLVACGGGGGDPVGLETSHGGRGLGAWMEAYWSAALMGGTTTRDGDVVFLPLPNATDPDGDGILTGTISTSVARTETIALPLFVWIGETYTPATMMADDDRSMPTRETFLATDIVLTLDGRTLIDTATDSLEPYYFEAQDFDETIVYETPTDYGASGAIWVKGIGVLHQPLAAGTHTLHLVEASEDGSFGFDNTWTITVE